MTPRNYRNHVVAAALIAPCVFFSGCALRSDATAATAGNASKSGVQAGRVVPANVAGVNRVVLTLGTAERLGIQTASVREMVTAIPGESGAAVHKVIPIAAVFYDKNGATWTYTNPEPLNYVRQPVKVARIDGDFAVLQSGPAVGTTVVTLGGPELAGIEDGVAGE